MKSKPNKEEKKSLPEKPKTGLGLFKEPNGRPLPRFTAGTVPAIITGTKENDPDPSAADAEIGIGDSSETLPSGLYFLGLPLFFFIPITAPLR